MAALRYVRQETTMNPAASSPSSEPSAPLPRNPPVLGAREEERLVSGERLRLIALAALTALLLILCAVMAVPFFPAITWGVALAIVAWPLHVWVSRRIQRPSWAAALTLTAVILVILVPGLFVAYQLAQEAGSAADQMQRQQAGGNLREAMLKVPALQGTVAWMDRMQLDADEAVRKVLGNVFGDVHGLIQGSVMALIQFALALFILFHLLRDRPAIMQTVRRLLPLS